MGLKQINIVACKISQPQANFESLVLMTKIWAINWRRLCTILLDHLGLNMWYMMHAIKMKKYQHLYFRRTWIFIMILVNEFVAKYPSVFYHNIRSMLDNVLRLFYWREREGTAKRENRGLWNFYDVYFSSFVPLFIVNWIGFLDLQVIHLHMC